MRVLQASDGCTNLSGMLDAVQSATPAQTPNMDGAASGDRTPPHSIEAEEALLGTLLHNDRAYEYLERLRGAHFYVPVNGRIFEAARLLIQQGRRADAVTLRPQFAQDEALADVDDYLGRLVHGAMPPEAARHYGDIVLDLANRRALIEIGARISGNAASVRVDVSAASQIEDAEQRLFEISEHGRGPGAPRPFVEGLTEAIQAAENAYQLGGRLSGITSGIRGLDALLGGFHRSDLIILAGRPGMGKTALAVNFAQAASRPEVFVPWEDRDAKAPGTVAVFSLEMAATQLANRILSSETGISSEAIRRGTIRDEELTKLIDVSKDLEDLRLFIDDTAAITIPQLRTRARRLMRTENGLRLIVVDYLQLMTATRNQNSRVNEISEISQGLKSIAMELNVPVIALSQLSRQVESREDKRPQLQDLRDSGTIEQDADVVLFIFREHYYVRQQEPQQRGDESDPDFKTRYDSWKEKLQKTANAAQIFVSKQRHGSQGDVKVHFEPHLTRFQDPPDSTS